MTGERAGVLAGSGGPGRERERGARASASLPSAQDLAAVTSVGFQPVRACAWRGCGPPRLRQPRRKALPSVAERTEYLASCSHSAISLVLRGLRLVIAMLTRAQIVAFLYGLAAEESAADAQPDLEDVIRSLASGDPERRYPCVLWSRHAPDQR